MNKNLKVISSLAMAGILAATGISSVSNAATIRSLGVYRKLVEGKVVVPYVLENSNDSITAKNVKDEHGNIIISLSDGSTVKTGTTFRKAGEEHTIVVYGDVNSDGRVNVNDVTETAKAVFTTPTGVVKEAADVAHDGKINVNDVTTLAKFIVKKEALNISLKAEPVEDVKYEYTLAVNENNVVNNTNNTSANKSTIRITPKNGFKAEDSFTMGYAKQAEDGTYPTNTTVGSTINGFVGNENYKDIEVDVSAFNTDGTYRLQLLKSSKVVGEVVITVNTDITKMSANVIATRMTNDTAALSFSIPEEAKITKVYCLAGAAAQTESAVVKKENLATVPNTVIRRNGNDDTSFKVVTYVLVNEYGNTLLKTVNIPATNAAESKIDITKIVANDNNIFVVSFGTAPVASQKIIATLYKDGKAIYTDDTLTTGTNATQNVDLSGRITEVGTYTLKAYIAATETEKQSIEVDSAVQPEGTSAAHKDDGKIVMTKLAAVPVSGINFNETTGKVEWTDTTNNNVKYEIVVKKAQKDSKNKFTGYATDTIKATQDGEDKKATLSANLQAGVCYKFEIVAKDKDNSKRVIPSEPVQSEEVYVVPTPSFSASVVNSTTVKLTGITPVTVLGKEDATVSYEVEIYKVEGEASTPIQPNRTVQLTETKGGSGYYETVIDGLTAEGKYKLVLVVKVGDKIKKSNPATLVNMTKPEKSVDGLVVDNTATAPAKGKVSVIKTSANGVNPATYKAYIDGEEIENINVFSAKYQAVLTDIVARLSKDDKIVTVSENKVVLQLNNKAIGTLTLGSYIEEKEIELTGNEYTRTVSIDEDKEASKVTLTGGSFAINTKLAEEVILNGVEVFSSNLAYTLKANANNTIDRIKTIAKSDAIITKTGVGALTVTAGSSDVEFNYDSALAITVKGEGKNTQTHTGKITIINKGNVSLATNNAVVEAPVNVTITNGTLTGLDNINFTGKQNITIYNRDNTITGTVITAKLAQPAPFTTDIGETAVAKQYEQDATVENITLGSGKEMKDAIDFMNKLGLAEEDSAVIEITNTNVIKITIKGDISNYVVPGLQ